MLTHEFKIRVRYSETDQMGFVYYGNYAAYLEVGRVETLRELGFPYKELEARGVLLPVVNLTVNYRKPAVYDDLLTIKTSVKQVPSIKFIFESEIVNEQGDLLIEASVTLVFIDKEKNKPVPVPEWFAKATEKYFI